MLRIFNNVVYFKHLYVFATFVYFQYLYCIFSIFSMLNIIKKGLLEIPINRIPFVYEMYSESIYFAYCYYFVCLYLI